MSDTRINGPAGAARMDPGLECGSEIGIPVRPGDVQLSLEARRTIGQGVWQVARACGLFGGELADRLRGGSYRLLESGALAFAFSVPEAGADMELEIPPEHWRFKEELRPAQ